MDVCILLTSRMGVLRGGVGFCVSQEAKPRLHREDRSLAESFWKPQEGGGRGDGHMFLHSWSAEVLARGGQ